jgi:energy-coupling factor transporter ATP-binding protein EcfA2
MRKMKTNNNNISRQSSDRVRNVIDRLHRHEIDESGVGRYRFVDRDVEARKIIDENENVISSGWVTVLYGPKGCGKTRFFEALYNALEDVNTDIDMIIVGAEERETAKAYIKSMPMSLKDLFKRIALESDVKIDPVSHVLSIGVTVLGVGSVLARWLAKTPRRGRRLFIVLDEVRLSEDSELVNFRQWLESFSNDLRNIDADYRRRGGGGISVIALTSDATVSSLRSYVGGKVDWVLIWNLTYDSMKELLREIGLETDPSLLWRLTGGNPRSIVYIKRRGLENWLREEVIRNLFDLYKDVHEIFREDLWREFEAAVENIDYARQSLVREMLKRNIVIDIGASQNIISEIPREPWINRYYAYQIPAYHHVLKIMTEKKSIDIEPREVIDEI